jgi:chemotaxis protein CheD
MRETFLQPGDVAFGDEATRMRTLLGSCVAITLWHPEQRVGGMCHYMLPTRGSRHGGIDGRYGDEALALLLDHVRRVGCQPSDFEAKLFGGGYMFDCTGRLPVQVQNRNILAARALVAAHGLAVKAEHLGGRGHRQIVFELWSGDVWMKHTPLPPPSVGRSGDAARPRPVGHAAS